jgi:peptide/nickel transport system permease protein
MAQVGFEQEPTTTDVQAPLPEGGQSAAAIQGKSPWQLFWRRFKKDRWAIGGMWCLALIFFLAIFGAPIAAKVTGHPPGELYPSQALNSYGLPHGPNAQFWFGADGAGRDLFVRILYGARTSLIVALSALVFELALGVPLGIIAGYYRGKTDTAIMRSADVFYALPTLLLALGLVAACGASKEGCFGGLLKPGMLLVAIVIGVFGWPYIARIIRGQVLSLREKEFIEASRSLGARDSRIMFREILPNVLAPIIVYATLTIPVNILFEAALSFLGIGVPPDVPSWGSQLNDAQQNFPLSWWTMLFPGLFILFTTLAFNLVGDGLRDAFDPRTG